jgi:hypothetical protein
MNVVGDLRKPQAPPHEQRMDVPDRCLGVLPPFHGEVPELTQTSGYPDQITQSLVDLQGLPITTLSFLIITPILRHHPQMVIVAGHSRLITQPLANLQGLSITTLSPHIITPQIRKISQRAVADGHSDLMT